MAETILPDVYIEVRPEGLIVPTQINIGRVGMVGTSTKGLVNTPTTVTSASEARQIFGTYGDWTTDPDTLTLVRGLELAFDNGASTVIAVRAANTALTAERALPSATGTSAVLKAASPGTWGATLSVSVAAAEDSPLVEDEEHKGSEAPMRLKKDAVQDARNRVVHRADATGVERPLAAVYAGAAAAGEVKIDTTTSPATLTFGDVLLPADDVTVSYAVPTAKAAKVTVTDGTVSEIYTVTDGADLVKQIGDPATRSQLVTAADGTAPTEIPAAATAPASFAGGTNGAVPTNGTIKAGLDALLDQDAHIIVAPGRDETQVGGDLDAHCRNASTDALKRDRIGVVGSRVGATFDQIRGHTMASERIVFVAPGIVMTDRGATSDSTITLPGSFTAAAVAGLIAGLSPHVSPTNKTLTGFRSLEQPSGRALNAGQLAQLVQARVLAVMTRKGTQVVKGITTDTGSAFAQITTRRIVDYAKFGVRSAAGPYIGLLNNERVRGALRASVNSFLAEMVTDEMLVSYDLAVTATRDEERRGIARVTMTLRPTFSIDYIRVTMFLE